MPVLTVEKPLRDKLGDDGLDSLFRLINESRDEQKRDTLEFVEEKFERRLSEEIGALELRLTDRINNVDKRLSAQISQSSANMIKWMFIFWVGQVGVILGMLFAFFK